MTLSITVSPAGPPESLDGVPVRPWKGTDADGLEYLLYVHRIASTDPAACTKLAETLVPVDRPPGVYSPAEFVALVAKMRACQQAALTPHDVRVMHGYEDAVDRALAALAEGN